MDLSRRELHFLLPLLAGQARAEEHPVSLNSKIYHPDQSTDLHGQPKKGGRIFFGTDHSGFALEMHQTVLGPGVESHPPHKHVHEEIMIVLDGSLETYVEGKTETAEKGAIIYYGSNQLHQVRNAGQVPARYYVLELRGHSA
ncbi:MAG: cupin domain-containing protein [Bryobacteraceae bacterium]